MSAFEINFDRTSVTLSSGYEFKVCGKIAFDPGDTILILGENGSGKTTFLNLLHSIFEEERGSILSIDRQKVQGIRGKFRTAQVFQEPRENFISRCAADEIVLPLLGTKHTRSETIERIRVLADTADIYNQNVLRRSIDLLSSGEQQRIAICAALALNPTIMLWDEALARIDDQTAERLNRLLGEAALHRTVLFAATHRPQRFLRLFSRRVTSVILLSKDENVITLQQKQYNHEMKFPDHVSNRELNFRDRTLWDRYIYEGDSDSAAISYDDGVRVFSSKGESIINVENLKVFARYAKNPIVSLREAKLTHGLHYVVGRNGSGKTLFLHFIAGQFPINPRFKNINKIFTTASVASVAFGSLPQVRKSGLSAYLAGEPFRWITDSTVEAELSRYQSGRSLEQRYAILSNHGIKKTDNPDYLSYGQKKLVCLLSLPEKLNIVCLDEPFADLSLSFTKEVEAFLDHMISESNWQIVLVSQASDIS